MENDRLDRLFREKLESYETAPSAEAWSNVARETKKTESSNLLWKVAAAVTVVTTACFLLWQGPGEIEMRVAIADHPVRPETAAPVELQLPTKEPKEGSQAVKLPATDQSSVMKVTRAAVSVEFSEVVASSVETPTVAMPTIELSSKREVLALGRPSAKGMALSTEVDNVQPKPAVSIKYYAENVTDSLNQNDKKGLGTFLAKAQTFNPADFLADLRAAKDDLLRSKRLN